MPRRSLLLLSPLVLALAATDAFAAQRVFVRSNGVDAGACTLAAPCRGFTYAMTQVDVGGEVVALDAAGYGAVLINKSVTITANPGFFAGVTASSGNAIEITGIDVNVILRGLNLNGLGATHGVYMTQGSSLTMENCVVSNFGIHGIYIETAAKARLTDITVRGNGFVNDGDGIRISHGALATITKARVSRNAFAGIGVVDGGNFTTGAIVTDSDTFNNAIGMAAGLTSTGIARLSVRGSSASNNFYGIFSAGASANSEVAVSNSIIAENDTGFLNNPGGTFESFGNNVLRGNVTPTSGTITVVMGQ